MLNVDELKQLSSWCAVRTIGWRPLLCAGEASVLLEPRGRPAGWQRMTLARLDETFELCAEDGALLAASTDLRSVLDALDGGVAEPVAGVDRPAERSAAGALVF